MCKTRKRCIAVTLVIYKETQEGVGGRREMDDEHWWTALTQKRVQEGRSREMDNDYSWTALTLQPNVAGIILTTRVPHKGKLLRTARVRQCPGVALTAMSAVLTLATRELHVPAHL